MHWVRYGVLIAVLVVFGGGAWFYINQPEARQLPVNTKLGGDFTLDSTLGKPFDTHDLRGKVVLLNFGYTHCPDICPAVLARISQAYKELVESGDANKVRVVFVTFDPERDTVAHMQEYLAWFHQDIIGMTGSLEKIEKAAKKYGVVFIKQDDPEQKYLYAHSDFTYLLDQEGRVRKLYPVDMDIDEVVKDVKSLF